MHTTAYMMALFLLFYHHVGFVGCLISVQAIYLLIITVNDGGGV